MNEVAENTDQSDIKIHDSSKHMYYNNSELRTNTVLSQLSDTHVHVLMFQIIPRGITIL